MIDFSQAQYDRMVIHLVGNKAKEEILITSQQEVIIEDELVTNCLQKYFLSPFQSVEQFYCFDDLQHTVCEAVQAVFQAPQTLLEKSVFLAQRLFECGELPQIKGGEFYMVYFKDCILEDELVDAIGIFKTEHKDVFLKVYPNQPVFDVQVEEGININKLDKGCLIFNTWAEKGYRIALTDTVNKHQLAKYWKSDFLGLKAVENAYFSTVNYMELVKNYAEDCLSVENNVPKENQLHFLKKSQDFFSARETFDLDDFKKEVIIAPEMAEAFDDYKMAFAEEHELPAMDKFQISTKAVNQKGEKFFRSVIKLDKNFHVYVHGNSDFIETGFDADRKLSFYKLYYKEEA